MEFFPIPMCDDAYGIYVWFGRVNAKGFSTRSCSNVSDNIEYSERAICFGAFYCTHTHCSLSLISIISLSKQFFACREWTNSYWCAELHRRFVAVVFVVTVFIVLYWCALPIQYIISKCKFCTFHWGRMNETRKHIEYCVLFIYMYCVQYITAYNMHSVTRTAELFRFGATMIICACAFSHRLLNIRFRQ